MLSLEDAGCWHLLPSLGWRRVPKELNEVAAAMDDPRQCGRCGFGPVDHRGSGCGCERFTAWCLRPSGCSDLSAHHGEVSIPGGAAISNRCPRAPSCSWSAESTNLVVSHIHLQRLTQVAASQAVDGSSACSQNGRSGMVSCGHLVRIRQSVNTDLMFKSCSTSCLVIWYCS